MLALVSTETTPQSWSEETDTAIASGSWDRHASTSQNVSFERYSRRRSLTRNISIVPELLNTQISVHATLEQCRLLVGLNGDSSELRQVDFNAPKLGNCARRTMASAICEKVNAVLVTIFDLWKAVRHLRTLEKSEVQPTILATSDSWATSMTTWISAGIDRVLHLSVASAKAGLEGPNIRAPLESVLPRSFWTCFGDTALETSTARK
jgi:hypothetical protein